jgi:disulfide bond formation protein DsbB
MTPERLSLLFLLAGLAVIGGAFYFQDVVGLQPCELCLKERVPWYTAIVAAALWGTLRHGNWVDRAIDPVCVFAFALLFAVSGGLAVYHVAVEQHWVAGPDTCTAHQYSGMTLAEITKALMTAPPVRCDVVQWRFLGVSLAGWNGVLSAAMIALSLASLRRKRGSRRFG